MTKEDKDWLKQEWTKELNYSCEYFRKEKRISRKSQREFLFTELCRPMYPRWARKWIDGAEFPGTERRRVVKRGAFGKFTRQEILHYSENKKEVRSSAKKIYAEIRAWKRKRKGLKRKEENISQTSIEQQSTEKTGEWYTLLSLLLLVPLSLFLSSWPASIVYVETVVGSCIDCTFASLPPMVRNNETASERIYLAKIYCRLHLFFDSSNARLPKLTKSIVCQCGWNDWKRFEEKIDVLFSSVICPAVVEMRHLRNDSCNCGYIMLLRKLKSYF